MRCGLFVTLVQKNNGTNGKINKLIREQKIKTDTLNNG